MSFLHDDVRDNGLQDLTDSTSTLHICSQEPATWLEATDTYTLGNKNTPSVSAPQDGSADGRRVVISAITDGDVTTSGTATHYALVDNVAEKLLATESLSDSVEVSADTLFTLTEFSITIPD